VSERLILPQRRLSVTFTLRFWNQDWNASVGYFDNNRPGEVFINAAKTPGTELEVMCRDSAILMSLLLQHGGAPELIQRALSRNGNGQPSSIAGAVIDVIREIQP
jgi:hypothetical protein